MHFPRNFEARRAIEAATLVQAAYDQFEAFEHETPWTLPKPYGLVATLSYTWGASDVLDSPSWIDKSLGWLLKKARKAEVRLPLGFVARKNRELFVVFRGTKTPQEWVNNLNARLVPHPQGLGAVHDGFQSIYAEIRPQVLQALDQAPGSRVFLAGHSLGGAFATLATLDVGARSRVGALYTFGSPRVGDGRFVQAFNQRFGARSFRVANSSDMVTEIPFPTPLVGVYGGYFSHVDNAVVWTVQKEDVVLNHRMQTYLDTLKKTAGDEPAWKRLLRRLGS